MVRVLKHFGMSCPCSAPLHLVAHKQSHASTVLSGIYSSCHQHPDLSAAQAAVSQELRAQLLSQIPHPLQLAVLCPYRCHMPEELRSIAQEKAKIAIPRLQQAFVDFELFHKRFCG